MDKEYILKVLIEIDKELDKLTSGNVAHKKASLKWAIQELIRIFTE